MEGDTVALHTGLTEVQTGDVIDWRFGPNAILIARVNRAAGTTKLYDDVIDGRDRLYINEQVGDLIITNIRTELSGLYKLSIHGRNKEMIYNVSGEYVILSDKTDGVKTVPVMEGDSVTLHTDVTEIPKYHLIQWIFENIVISSIDKTSKVKAIKKHNTKPFLNKLEVDHETGSLKIRSIRTEQCGIYILQMTSSTHTILCADTDAVKSVSVMKEDSVTLHTDLTDIYDEILWMFEYEDSLIAAFNRIAQNVSIYDDVLDGRFRDRLKLDDQTGSLTITNTTTEHTGLYHLEIISSRHTLHKSFIVNVCRVHCCGSTEAVIRLVVSAVVGVATVILLVYDIRSTRGD
ncbi:hypothetical protein PO909_028307 [Leuciscus waleckii]